MRRFLILLVLLPSLRAGERAAETPILPPLIPWKLEDATLTVSDKDPWVTHFEKSGRKETPRYAAMVTWLKRLVEAAPELSMVSLGLSAEGRDIWMVIASREKASTPRELAATNKPTLLAQGGIHSGEIDGKDAGLMLLRDMTVRGTKKDLLDKATFLFIPILSVDGHERFGPHSRVNQRGPSRSGWRTNARNLNLNRDYAKLETAGVRAAVRAIREWAPDLYYDIHVTDGADYQYDITWGHNGRNAHSPASAQWLDEHLTPRLEKDLRAKGHIPGPLVFSVDRLDMKKGIRFITFGPRYSHGYGDLAHLPTLLVENHSLKPYDQRVFGTYVLLESTLRALGEHGAALRKAIKEDRARRPAEVVLTWKVSKSEPPKLTFLGIGQEVMDSEISGAPWVRWTGKPVTLQIPYVHTTAPDLEVARPKAYWVPAAWPDVIERLQLHGVQCEFIELPREVEVEMDRIVDPRLNDKPFEGRVRITATFKPERRKETVAAGSVRVSTDQPLGDLAIALLEPGSPDSFFQWGFFHEVLQRTEYIEGYVLEPMARRMLAEDPKLQTEFEERLKDKEFAQDPRARLRWFYERTPFFDARWRLYPVARER